MPKRKRTKPGAARTAAREGGTKYPLLGPSKTSRVPKIKTYVAPGKPVGKGKTVGVKGAWGLTVGVMTKYPSYSKKPKKVSSSVTVSTGKQSRVPPKYKGR
jgi:hypothetical protein